MKMREVGSVLLVLLFLPVYAVIGAWFLAEVAIKKRRMVRKQRRRSL